MAKAQAHFRLEPDLLEAIKARAEAEKVTVTDLVTRFLMQGLGLDIHVNTQSVYQGVIEKSIHQRISECVAESISELNSSWEERISERISECVLELNSNWEKRISERISKSISELNSSWEERISERILELNSNWEKRISECVAESISELNSSWEGRISERVAKEDIVSSPELDDSQVSGNLRTEVSRNVGSEVSKKEELESPVELNIIESTSNQQSSLLEELALSEIKLGERLSINRTTLGSRRKKLSAEKFAEITSEKDPDSIKWVYSEKLKSYVPLEVLSDGQSENLKNWKEQH